MKVIIIRTNLKQGLGAVEGACGNDKNLPILKNVLLEAKDNKIKLTTTNLEFAIYYSLSGKVIEEGRVAIPFRVFYDLISNLQSERINLENHKEGLRVTTDNYDALIHGLPPEEFPLIPKIKNTDEYLEFRGGTLREAFHQILPSAQLSDLRPELGSVFFLFSLESLRCTTTDSFRLSEKTLSGNHYVSTHTKGFSLLLPLGTAHELPKIVQDDDDVRIFHDENQILIRTSRSELISRLLEGSFPDYGAIVPKTFTTEITVHRDEFLHALKLINALGGAGVSEATLRVHENKKSMEIFSQTNLVGENRYRLPIKGHGTAREARFNVRYLMDGLKAIKEDEVFLGMNEDNQPSLLRSIHDASYFYIVMPILKA